MRRATLTACALIVIVVLQSDVFPQQSPINYRKQVRRV